MHGFAWAWLAGWLFGWLIVAAVLAPVVGRWIKGYDGRHVLPDVQEEYDAWMAERGSMILAEEHPLEPLPAPTVDAHPWLDRTLADLAPEALEITQAEHDAAKAHLIERYGEVPESLQRIEDMGGRYAGPIPHDEPEREEIVLPAYGGWISGPCLDPGLGDAAVEFPPASPGPDQPSQWLADQLYWLSFWAEWQPVKAAILAWR